MAVLRTGNGRRYYKCYLACSWEQPRGVQGHLHAFPEVSQNISVQPQSPPITSCREARPFQEGVQLARRTGGEAGSGHRILGLGTEIAPSCRPEDDTGWQTFGVRSGLLGNPPFAGWMPYCKRYRPCHLLRRSHVDRGAFPAIEGMRRVEPLVPPGQSGLATRPRYRDIANGTERLKVL